MLSTVPPAVAIKHLYIHIPFCHRRCSYCDFNTYANMEQRIEAYVQALCRELALLALEQPAPNAAVAATTPLAFVSPLRPTIFLGGGTPSMLTLDQMERVLQAASALVPLANAEITIEANPGAVLGADMSAFEYLRGLRELGVNRLSMGVQSLHDPTLRMLGRIHTAAEAQRCFGEARRAGFTNINLDFIFGLPNQSLAQWEATLDEIVTWEADHFSLYSLILEERTPLYAQVTGGRLQVPDEDATAAMYEAAIERLAAGGYVQYEISNWARASDQAAPAVGDTPAFACQHNLAYWFNCDYWAAGAGAHGHVYPQRYYDILGINEYIAAVEAGQRPIAEVTPLTHADLCAETMFMGLRLNRGVTLEHFRARCAADLDAVYGPTLSELLALGLIERDASSVRLSAQGRMLGNQVFERFV